MGSLRRVGCLDKSTQVCVVDGSGAVVWSGFARRTLR